MRLRLLLGAVGVAMGFYGALRFLQRDLGQVVDSVLWLAGGVAVHDAVIAPLTLGGMWLGSRFVPAHLRTRVVTALVIILTVTVVAIPVLGKFGERADNPTLLDRNYVAGWLVLVLIVLVVTFAVGPLVGRRQPQTVGSAPDTAPDDPPDTPRDSTPDSADRTE